MKRRHLFAALLLSLVALLAVRLLGREPPSDEEAIRALFDDAARAAAEKRVGDAVAGVSEHFEGRGLDRQGVKRLVAALVLRGDWVSASVSGITVAVEGDRARAVVDVVLARGGEGKALADLLPQEGSAHRISCTLAREGGDWRVVAADWTPITLADALAGPPDP